MGRGLYKGFWKWLLFISAAIAFVFTIIYSNKLFNNIAQEERQRIKIWADAISYKAQFVNETERFFSSIKTEENNHAKILATAVLKASEADLDEDLTFYLDIITSNKTVPLLICKPNGQVDAATNIPDSLADIRNIHQLDNYVQDFDSIKLEYYRNKYLLVYYKRSPIYENLHIEIDRLLQSFFQETVINSASVPVIITDSTRLNVVASGNIDSAILKDKVLTKETLAQMQSQNKPIELNLLNYGTCYVFYKESTVLKQLRMFPYIQLIIVLVFIIIAYLLFSVTRKSEQNRVWVGMSKETAHQLGTPISSLMAWTELLKEMPVDQSIPTEIGKDVHRLETIAQRFSKIGSSPELVPLNLIEVIDEFVPYLQSRVSSLVALRFNKPESDAIILPINRYLFEWVIENLCKNAIDAMNGKGAINIDIIEDGKKVYVDISDTGRGIPAKLQKKIFYPGYTSKSRGWGLGLTLARRIINEYHKGKLFVKSSVIDHGTVMRIQLRK